MSEIEEDRVDELTSLLKPGSRIVTSDFMGENQSNPMVIVDADEYDVLVAHAGKAYVERLNNLRVTLADALARAERAETALREIADLDYCLPHGNLRTAHEPINIARAWRIARALETTS